MTFTLRLLLAIPAVAIAAYLGMLYGAFRERCRARDMAAELRRRADAMLEELVAEAREHRYSFTVYDGKTGEIRLEEYTGPAISSPGGVS